MELAFEIIDEIGEGNYPDLLHMYDNEAQALYLIGGLMYGKTTFTPYGEWEDRVFEEPVKVLNLTDLSHFEIKKLGGFGAVGVIKAGDSHKLLIYEFQHNISEYLVDGSIKYSAGSPIVSFTLTLENPIDDRTENDENVVVSENTSLLSPGAKVIFRLRLGENLTEIDLGTYYVDRSQFDLLSSTASVDGRNLIGKALKDQSLNENNSFSLDTVTQIIKDILKNANLLTSQYKVEETTEERRFEFEPNKDGYAALEEITKAMINWKIEETQEGIIGVGSPDYSFFPDRGIYTFYRNKDIFSRQITRDDQEAYRKVCVHTSDWSMKQYADVSSYSGWNLQSNKTLFVVVPDGTSVTDAELIAIEVAGRIENVGKIENFTGPPRPQLLEGDGAYIVDQNGQVSNLGLITEIEHHFGKNGISTDFSVDSGGQLGKGRITDFIKIIANARSTGSIAYEDIIPEVPTLADLTEYNATLAAVTEANYTPASWATYQVVVLANVMTTANTQTQVDLATIKIQLAQSKLVLI